MTSDYTRLNELNDQARQLVEAAGVHLDLRVPDNGCSVPFRPRENFVVTQKALPFGDPTYQNECDYEPV